MGVLNLFMSKKGFSTIILAQQGLRFSFTQYTETSGLISNQINTVLQDDEGFIWIGTTDGLQRFDGVRYKTFRHSANNPFSIPSNPVIQLLLDNKRNLWVLLADGRVGIFNTDKFTFRLVEIKTKKPNALNTSHRRLLKDESGNIFFQLWGNEVLTWNEKANEFSTSNNFFKAKDEWGIGDFVHQPGTKKYWMTITDGRIAIYNDATKQISYPGNNIENEPVIEKLKNYAPFRSFFDKQGRLWFCTWGEGFPYVHCYDTRENKMVLEKASFISELKTYYEVSGFFQQDDGTIWTHGQGVFARFNEKEKKFELVHNGYMNERSIAFEIINCFFEDREKNVWVATDNNGLYRFNPAREFFTNINHTNRVTGRKGDGSSLSFIHTKWNTVLSGAWGDGIFQYDENFKEIATGIKNIDSKLGPSAWCMIASADSNTIWVAAQPGIHAIDQKNRVDKFYNPSVFQNKTVRQVAEDKYGNLWMGLQGFGVFKWTKSKGAIKFEDGIKRFDAIPIVQINRIMVDSKGYVWIGTESEGVYAIDPETGKVVIHFGNKETGGRKLPEPGVSDILEYDDSSMVITTGTYIGIYNRVLNHTRLIGSPDMLSGFIASMQKDKQGYVWLATTNGLYRINIQKKIFVKFNRTDGIDNDHFILASSYALPDGRLIFGSSNHFIVFDPAKIQVGTTVPEIMITDFKVMNKSLLVDSVLRLKEIELGYKSNSLVVEFSSLNYTNSFLIQYKLEGVDADWKIADKTNQAVYSYLKPGTYYFLLNTLDEDGKEGKEIQKFILTIKPPFWKTWWFYSLFALLTAGLLFWLDRERMKRKEAIQKMRINIADDLHREVNAALGNINILSEMARMKAETEPQKSKEFIEQIQGKSHNMMIAMDDMLWAIDPENDNMGKIILRVREYIDGLRNRHGVQIDLLVDKNVEVLQLNMKLRKELFWLFKSGITNVVKTGGHNCKMHISFERPNLLYTLEFDNTKSDMQQLNNLRQRKELMDKIKDINASFDVQILKTKMIFLVTIPVV
jgi:ligand-binding sensor domain-containing protein